MKQMNAIVNVLGYKSHKSLLIKSAPVILIYEKIRNVVCFNVTSGHFSWKLQRIVYL